MMRRVAVTLVVIFLVLAYTAISLCAQGFRENLGQYIDQRGKPNTDILFVYTDSQGMLALGSSTLYHYQVRHGVTDSICRTEARFIGANPRPRIRTESVSAGVFNYYNVPANDGVLGVHEYEKVIYEELYPGIDMVLYKTRTGVKSDFLLKPGANPNVVKVMYTGHTALAIHDEQLVVTTPYGSITEGAPYSYMKHSGQIVKTRYAVRGDTVSFILGKYDSNLPLVIDPSRSWTTYMGGAKNDIMASVDVDRAFHMVSTGTTESINLATTGAYQTLLGGTTDVIISRFRPDGTIRWCTYFGGADEDEDFGGCAIDTKCNVVVYGFTASAASIASAGAHRGVLQGDNDVFLAKFDSTGKRLWSTYYGSESIERFYSSTNGIAIDSSDRIYITAATEGNTGISTLGADQPARAGSTDIFIASFDPDGTLRWGTYCGTSGFEYSGPISASADGIITLCGYTDTDGLAYHTKNPGYDMLQDEPRLLMRYTNVGTPIWRRYWGRSKTGLLYDVDVHPDGSFAIVGSCQNQSPADPKFGDNTLNNNITASTSGILAYFDNDGMERWSLYVGGSKEENIASVQVVGNHIYLAGYTTSTDLPVMNAYEQSFRGIRDGLFAKYDRIDATPYFVSYYGGTQEDFISSIRYDGQAGIYLSGETTSPSYHGDVDSYIKNYAGLRDGFLSHLCLDTVSYKLAASRNLRMCIGDSIVLTANPGYSTTTWNLISGSSSILLQTGSSYRYDATALTNNAGVYRIAARSTSKGRCDGVSDTLTITVTQKPLVDVGKDTSVCKGSSISISATGVSTSLPLKYAWTPSKGLSSTNTAVTVAAPDTATMYHVVVTDANGCTAEDSIMISIASAPSLATLPPIALCQGDTTLLTFNASHGKPPYRYAWIPFTGLTTPSSGTTKASPNTTTTYMVTVEDANGCMDSSYALIKVNPKPRPRIVRTGTELYCVGFPQLLSISQNYSSVKWSTSDTTPTITINGPGAYWAIVTDALGCKGSTDTIIVGLGKRPASQISGPGAACIGSTTSYTIPTGSTATWALSGGGALQNVQNTSCSVAWDAEGVWQLRLHSVSVDGCSIDTAISVVVADSLNPEVLVEGSTVLCDSSVAVLTAVGYTKVRWSNGATTPSITVSQSGSYSVYVESGSGCTGTSKTIEIKRSASPRPKPSITSDALYICPNTPLKLRVEPFARVEWSSGESVQEITIVKSGRYFVRAYNADGCVGMDSIDILAGDIVVPVVSGIPLAFPCAGEAVTLQVSAPGADIRWSTGATTPSIVVTDDQRIWVTATSSTGCAVTSDTITIMYARFDSAQIRGPLTVCKGSTITYNVANNDDRFEWDVTNAQVLSAIDADSVRFLFSALGNARIRLIRTAMNSSCADTLYADVTVADSLRPGIYASQLSACQGDTIVLTTDASYKTYQWSRDGIDIQGASTPTLSTTTSATYAVRVSLEECNGSSPGITVTFNPVPTSTPILRQSDSMLVVQTQWNVVWMRNDTVLNDETNATLKILVPGVYRAIFTNQFGCADTSAPYTIGAGNVLLPLRVVDTHAEVGSIFNLYVVCDDTTSTPRRTQATWRGTLVFNATMLFPKVGDPGPIVTGQRQYSVSGTYNGMSDTIAFFPFVATLGNDTCTNVELVDVVWDSNFVTDSAVSGRYCTDGLCYVDGSPRLLVSGTISRVLSVAPNPASSELTVSLILGEPGPYQLFLVDVLGNTYALDTRGLSDTGVRQSITSLDAFPSGAYTGVFTTPSLIRTFRLIIK